MPAMPAMVSVNASGEAGPLPAHLEFDINCWETFPGRFPDQCSVSMIFDLRLRICVQCASDAN